MSLASEALAQSLCACLPGPVRVEQSDSRAWASAGLSGERHRLDLRMPEAIADHLLENLGEREFDLRGHIVADVAAVAEVRDAGEARLVIEALTFAAD